MKTFYLLEGKVTLSNTTLEITNVSHWSLLKNKLLSVVAGLYIFDRTSRKIERGFDTIWDFILTGLVYIPLSIFVIYWLYMEFIQKSWINSMKIDAITNVTETVDENNPLNIILVIKSKFSTLQLSFRKSEETHKAFLESLQKLNSRFVIKHEII
ncbi:hypothetical protein [Kordia jejudonensis]|uniref:hypothetical protein n=1 Tax=Kordia jejudonensis TaxID=1348245 RepID=UPI0006299BCF|nr:hypothetical protein [Kordia jejudonensis]